jgi:hypothetical protein
MLAAVIFITYAPAIYAADSVVVQGVGYPPIKAENKAQAHLMAKRAAILDAYRNALKVSIPAEQSEDFYTVMSGYVRNARTLRVEYLEDGGVLVEMEVPMKDVLKIDRQFKGRARDGRNRSSVNMPKRVSIDEWYSIINKFTVYQDTQGQFNNK